MPTALVLVSLLLGSAPRQPTAPAATGQRPRLMVLPTQVPSDADARIGAGFSEAITAELARSGFYDVLSAADLQHLTGTQRQRELLGCEEETSCLTELADAVGAPFILTSGLARFGTAWQLTLQLLDVRKARQVGRSSELARDVSTLRARLPWTVASAAGLPPPPEPSRLMQYSLLGGGGLLVATSGVLAFNAFHGEAMVNEELRRGAEDPTDLATLGTYRQRLAAIGTQKTVAAVTAVAGIGLAAAGFLLLPPGPSGTGMALLVGPSGLALVGVFP